MASLGRAKLAQGHGGRIAGVLNFRFWLNLSGRFLNDAMRELIGVAGALTCSGRHVPIVAQSAA
jgi:hypothetical protein